MDRIAAEIEQISSLHLETIADSIQRIGFTCTDCGACCRGESGDADHAAVVYPDEIRAIQHTVGGEWDEVVRPMPYGGSDETFEWALRTDPCGDCRFHDSTIRGSGGCSIYAARPRICRTYPFQLVHDPANPTSGVVDTDGHVTAYECEGLGESIDREQSMTLAAELKSRALFELREARSVIDAYEPTQDHESLTVYDSEGPKTTTGDHID